MNKIILNKQTDVDALRRADQNLDVKRLEKNGEVESNRKSSAATGGDRLQFSDRAAEVGKLVDEIKTLPDVRQDRVDELREKIRTGEFQPAGKDIAEALIRDEG